MIMSASFERTVITYGTFDLFHHGHVLLLKRAKELGTKLIVGLSTDEFNLTKGKNSVMSYEYRKLVLESCRYVDHVIPEETWSQKIGDIKKYNVNLFVMGDDWAGKFNYLSDYCAVNYFERTPEVSTTKIKMMKGGFSNRVQCISSKVLSY
jgi:glycerol-3-phosphate cytidylyltransferase